MQSNQHHTSLGVVVTGMGLATSLGCDVDSTWGAIRRGSIGLGPMSEIESPLPQGAIGGQAMELPATYAAELPREARYLRWVIEQALNSAKFGNRTHQPLRCAIVLGTTLHGIRAGGRFLRSKDPSKLRHFLANSIMRQAIQGLGLQGPSITTCSACSSSLGAIALGLTMLHTGQVDLVIAGGYDAISEYAWAGFHALRLVAPCEVRPFAANREGMMPSEGYGVVVLERVVNAHARGASAIVQIEGWGESADAHHLTQPDPTGNGAARAMRDALSQARLEPTDISMIAAHATATPNNDASEYAAFQAVFGESLAQTPVVGFKSYLGHTLGAAGAVELILSACALKDNWVPPCATEQPLDGAFAVLTLAPRGGLDTPILRTLNTSLGFGGANTCVILGRHHGGSAGPVGISQPQQSTAPEAWITGYGLVLPGITGISALLERLADSPGLILPQGQTSVVSDEQLSQTFNVRRMRRLSMCVKLMLGSVSLAIRHAGLEDDSQRLSLASALLASTHGSSGFCVEYYTQLVREGVLSANPVLFAEGVPNAAAAHVSTNFGLRGACQTIIGSRTAGLDALGLAAMRIASGASQTILVGAAEETHPVVDGAYRHYNLQQSEEGERGFFSVPGAVAFVVESSISASARGVKPLARIGRYTGLSAFGSNAAACAEHCDTPLRALTGLGTSGAVLSSGNRTWIARAEAWAVRQTPGTTLVESLHDRVGELFAAGPLLAIVHALAQGRLSSMTAVCTDFTGTASAIEIEKFDTSGARNRV